MGGTYFGQAGDFLIDTVVRLYAAAVLLRFLLQLARADFRNPFAQAIVKVTTPALRPLRKVVPGWRGHDLAALVLVVAVMTLGVLLQSWLHGFTPALSGLLVVAIYGGYFNGGLGILLMALYTVTGESRLNTVNALKNLNSLVLSWLAVAAFVMAGAIAWKQGLLMMVAATAGGYVGARWSKQLPVTWVRRVVIVTGLVMSALFFWRG